MKKLPYYAILCLVRCFAVLPMWVLYRFSDFVFFLMYYVFGYRKKVVKDNLQHAFPSLSDKEIRSTMRKFYRHLCDVFIETISYNAWQKRALQSITIKNREIVDEIYDNGQHVVCMTSHYGNWEVPTLFGAIFKHILIGVYKPLNNKLADSLMFHNRSLYGSHPTAMADLFRKIVKCTADKTPGIVYLIADQRPAPHLFEHWLPFFGREVPVIIGPEKIARKFKCPVVFMDVQPTTRGHYDVTFSKLCDDAAQLPQNKIIEMYYARVEESIRKQPWAYLWSHKRWKFTR